jgi:phage terminase large subunit-like protein
LTPETSLGFSAVEFSRDVLGLEPLPWQRWLLIHALELRFDGRFRFRTVLVLVARQNGKTSIVEVKNLWKMFVLRTQVLGTAQNLDLSEESWNNAVEMIEGLPELAAEVKHIDRTNGKKAIRLANGARWKVAAASRKGGRGFSGDDVNLDELREHQTWEAWGAVTKTTLARPNPQIWAYSNAGDNKSVVLNNLQQKARATVEQPEDADSSLGLFEWSVPDGVKCDCGRQDSNPHGLGCQLANVEFWAMANPSLGHTISEESLRSALLTDPNEVFLTECLCQHVPSLNGGAIDVGQWADLLDKSSKRDGDIALGVDIAPNRDYASIALYGKRSDGLGHGQLIDYRAGTDWIVPRLIELCEVLDPVAIGMGTGTAKSLAPDLKEVGIMAPEDEDQPQRGDLLAIGGADMAAACGHVIDDVRQSAIRHIGQQQLDTAVSGAQTRQTGDTIAWSRKNTESDIAPLVGLTAARFAYVTRVDAVKKESVTPWAVFA